MNKLYLILALVAGCGYLPDAPLPSALQVNEQAQQSVEAAIQEQLRLQLTNAQGIEVSQTAPQGDGTYVFEGSYRTYLGRNGYEYRLEGHFDAEQSRITGLSRTLVRRFILR